MRGPYYKVVRSPTSTNGLTLFHRDATWYRTDFKQTERSPLPYSVVESNFVSGVKNMNGIYDVDATTCFLRQYLQTSHGRSSVYGNSIQVLHNKVYAKWLDKVRAAPQIGTDIAEFQQTLRMISSVLGALKSPIDSLITAYRKYNTKVLPGRKGRTVLRDMSGVWLAWHFGCEPLVKDLYDLLERLSHVMKPQRVTASSSQTLTYRYKANGQTMEEVYKQHVRISGIVTRTNENLALWNDLNLANPASIAWEIVPFSFVVDWFYPVGSFIGSITDLFGYNVKDAYTTWFTTGTGSYTLEWPQKFKTDPAYGIPVKFQGFKLDRTLEKPAMKAQKVRIPTSLSLSRAATQISLLLQILNLRR